MLDLVPVTPQIGAEVRGLDLREGLDEKHKEALRRALDEHLVLFFRNQPLSPEQHIEFGSLFGNLNNRSYGTAHPDYPEILVLDTVNTRNFTTATWHSDQTYMAEPPSISILRALELPSQGGDTCWMSMYAAYEGLSPGMQDYLAGLHAIHDTSTTLSAAVAFGIRDTSEVPAIQHEFPPRRHPVVRTNPETGRKALYVNRNATVAIEGLRFEESDAMLAFLFNYVSIPEFTCRFHWEVDSIAVWDNRYCQHYALADYNERRLMHRVTTEGGPVA